MMVLFWGGNVYWHWYVFGRAEVTLDALTALEKQIVILVAQGHTNREIAKKLGLAEQTVRNYLSAIYAKTGAKNRVRLTRLALRAGWIDSARQE